MNAAPATSAHQDPQALFADRQPIRWIVSVADQIAREASLDRTADIEDLVIIAYLGLLDSPHAGDLTHARLLTRCRRELITWAWEQGTLQEARPGTITSDH
jgi:hypothetical protein